MTTALTVSATHTLRKATMQIPKDKILELLRERGDDQKAGQAEQELPDQVDTERDKGLLDKFGINPQELLGKLGGGMPGL